LEGEIRRLEGKRRRWGNKKELKIACPKLLISWGGKVRDYDGLRLSHVSKYDTSYLSTKKDIFIGIISRGITLEKEALIHYD